MPRSMTTSFSTTCRCCGVGGQQQEVQRVSARGGQRRTEARDCLRRRPFDSTSGTEEGHGTTCSGALAFTPPVLWCTPISICSAHAASLFFSDPQLPLTKSSIHPMTNVYFAHVHKRSALLPPTIHTFSKKQCPPSQFQGTHFLQEQCPSSHQHHTHFQKFGALRSPTPRHTFPKEQYLSSYHQRLALLKTPVHPQPHAPFPRSSARPPNARPSTPCGVAPTALRPARGSWRER